jgi:hypothetical protein
MFAYRSLATAPNCLDGMPSHPTPPVTVIYNKSCALTALHAMLMDGKMVHMGSPESMGGVAIARSKRRTPRHIGRGSAGWWSRARSGAGGKGWFRQQGHSAGQGHSRANDRTREPRHPSTRNKVQACRSLHEEHGCREPQAMRMKITAVSNLRRRNSTVGRWHGTMHDAT